MNLLLMIIVALALLLILHGYKRGLFKSAVSMIGIVLAVFLTAFLYPYVNKLICQYTEIDEGIKAAIVKRFQIDIEETGLTRAEEMRLIEEISLPQNVKKWLIENGHKENFIAYKAKGFSDYVAIYLTELVMKGFAYLITCIVLMLSAWILIAISDIVTDIPIVHGIDKFGGVLFGAAQALILVWIVFIIITLLSAFEFGSVMMNMIEENAFLTWLYEKNIFLKFMVDILENI